MVVANTRTDNNVITAATQNQNATTTKAVEGLVIGQCSGAGQASGGNFGHRGGGGRSGDGHRVVTGHNDGFEVGSDQAADRGLLVALGVRADRDEVQLVQVVELQGRDIDTGNVISTDEVELVGDVIVQLDGRFVGGTTRGEGLEVSVMLVAPL